MSPRGLIVPQTLRLQLHRFLLSWLLLHSAGRSLSPRLSGMDALKGSAFLRGMEALAVDAELICFGSI